MDTMLEPIVPTTNALKLPTNTNAIIPNRAKSSRASAVRLSLYFNKMINILKDTAIPISKSSTTCPSVLRLLVV